MKNKVNVFFRRLDETLEDTKIHAVTYLGDGTRTLCGIVDEEWCYGSADVSLDEYITCKNCINILEETHKFHKTSPEKWR